MRGGALVAALALSACAPSPRPRVLEEVDRTRQGAAAKEAATLAPQAYLAAEKLRDDALAAEDGGDRSGAQLLSERALAAYARAHFLARLAKADERLTRAARAAEDTARELSVVEAQHARVAAEADDLDIRIRVIRDALPIAPSEPASAERERARLAAAKAMAVQARLLCVSAEMLGLPTAELAETWKGIADLEAEIARTPARAPIDPATALRSKCLSFLTRARRPATSSAPEAGAADALLAKLSEAELEPLRDDRGVVVVLRDLYQGTALGPSGRERVEKLGQVARAHADFPVVVVVHSARGRATERDKNRAASVAAALKAAGAVRVQAETPGDALPVAMPGRSDSHRRNERTEIVFVAPAL